MATLAEKTPAKQVHRGCLAGLTEKQRQDMVNSYVAGITAHGSEDAARALSERALAHAPEDRFAIMLMERSHEELRVMARDYNIRTADRMAHRDLVTAVNGAAAADSRDCELAFEWADELQYRSFTRVLDAGGRIDFSAENAAEYATLKPFPPYTFLYKNEGEFTFLVTDVFKDNLEAARTKGVAGQRATADNVAACASALVELYGVVEAHKAHETYLRWYPESALGFGAFAQCVIREAASHRYDFVCCNDGEKDYLVHYTLDTGCSAQGDDTDEATVKALEARDRIIEAHKHVAMKEYGPEVALLGAFEWKRNLEPVVELRNYLDECIPEGENEVIFADRTVEELLFATAAVSNMDIANTLLEGKGLGDLLQNDRCFLELITRVVEELPTWECNGWAPTEWHASNGRGKAKQVGEDGISRKVGRNDPCPCGSGLKYKKCCGK